jgi:hypothetical protein
MASTRKPAARTSKSVKLKDLKSKSVSAKKAGAVKGGVSRREAGGVISINHNQAHLS